MCNLWHSTHTNSTFSQVVGSLASDMNKKPAADKQKQAQEQEATREAAKQKSQEKVDQKQNPVAAMSEPTRTEKGLYSGNFVTPSSTPSAHAGSQPNALGGVPVLGSLLGGTGGPL